MKSITISIPTMKSAHCQMTVRQAVENIPHVNIASVESGTLTLNLQPEANTSHIYNAIEKAGYTIAGVETQSANTMQFKTNINCSGCVAKVTPALSTEDIQHWAVDTTTKDKILTVSSSLSQQDVMEKVKQAGFKIEPVQA